MLCQARGVSWCYVRLGCKLVLCQVGGVSWCYVRLGV